MPEYQQGTPRGPGSLLAAGLEVPFYIEDAKERISRADNETINLKALVYDFATKKWVGPIWSTLTFKESVFWQIDNFLLAIGEPVKKGAKVTLQAQDCIGKRGWCILDIRESEDKTVRYNVIRKWVRRRPRTDLPAPSTTKGSAPAPQQPPAANGYDIDPEPPTPGEPDDIPF
jgi:hypothetical protein